MKPKLEPTVTVDFSVALEYLLKVDRALGERLDKAFDAAECDNYSYYKLNHFLYGHDDDQLAIRKHLNIPDNIELLFKVSW